MAEAHKFNGSLSDAKDVFPELPWKQSAAGDTWVFDEKQGEYVAVKDGDYIVKIADRYEVSDKKPSGAKKAAAAEKKDDSSDDTTQAESTVPKAKEVEPPADPEAGEAEVASTPNGATSFE